MANITVYFNMAIKSFKTLTFIILKNNYLFKISLAFISFTFSLDLSDNPFRAVALPRTRLPSFGTDLGLERNIDVKCISTNYKTNRQGDTNKNRYRQT
jgi:hypothetical protein